MESPDGVTASVSRYNTRRQTLVTRQRMQSAVTNNVTATKGTAIPEAPLLAVSLRHAFVPFQGELSVCVCVCHQS